MAAAAAADVLNAVESADEPKSRMEREGGTVRLHVLDGLGAFGLTSATFAEWLNDAAGADVHVLLNSPGGSVFEGRAMANMLRSYSGNVSTEVVGLAASAAVSLLAASDETTIHPTGAVMIHAPFMLTMGNAAKLRKDAEMLDELTNATVDEYVAYTGMDADAMRDMVEAETLMNAEDAVANGFVGSILDTPKDAEQRVATEHELRAMVALAGFLAVQEH